MTSLRKQAANRRNAHLSTGPRTAAGKETASQNAREHGLAVPVSRHGPLARAARERADEMAGSLGRNIQYADLLAFSETLIDLDRIAVVQAHLTVSILENLRGETSRPEADANAVSDLIQQVVRLERYERRARSRRKAALRRFS